MKRLFLSLLLIITSLNILIGQIEMGGWRTHFAFNVGEQITQSENKVFVVSEGKLFSVDKRDKSIEYYSKLTGLSGNSVSNIKYDEDTKNLLIIYNDGNIDFLNANGVKNLADYYIKQISVDKTINHILFNNNKAYLSTKFGIMVLNMDRMEIQDTYYIGSDASEVDVLNTALLGEKIYAVSETDIYEADASNPNLINYENWQKLSSLPGSGKLQGLYPLGNWLILKRNNRLYKMDSANSWTAFDNVTNAITTGHDNGYLMVFTAADSFYYDADLNKYPFENTVGAKSAIFDNKLKLFWLIGNADGLTSFNPISKEVDIYKPEGPASNIAFAMKFAGEKLFVVQGGRWTSELLRSGTVMMFENNSWYNTEEKDILAMTGHNRAKDFMNIAVDPNDNTHFYVPSYGQGVFEFRDNKPYKWHNFENSTIETIYPDNPNSRFNYMRTDGGVYDKDGNVWFTNSSVARTIKILKSDNTWTYLTNEIITKMSVAGRIVINNTNNQKWFLSVRKDGAIIVLDDNGTLDNPNDDRYKMFKSLNYPANDGVQSITPNFFYDIVIDHKGAIWFATDMGPFVINNPNKAFDSDFLFNRIIIPRNDGTGQGDFLLEDQEILSIAIDGANRKWIGTKENGAYLLSENGLETIHHFTVYNSPLPSNEVSSIAINPVTGEVFLGTSSGLISFQSDAAEGSKTLTNVHAYPNPVRENFKGVVTITGLIDKSLVKITDSAGNLVYETYSNGSIATWDMNNKYGQRVNTGVYLAICTTPDNSESKVVKILVIN